MTSIHRFMLIDAKILDRRVFKEIFVMYTLKSSPSQGFMSMVLSLSCSLHHYKSTGYWLKSASVPLLILIHSSEREKSNQLLCDSMETCSFYVLTGRNLVVVWIFKPLQKSFTGCKWQISPVALENTLGKRNIQYDIL